MHRPRVAPEMSVPLLFQLLVLMLSWILAVINPDRLRNSCGFLVTAVWSIGMHETWVVKGEGRKE